MLNCLSRIKHPHEKILERLACKPETSEAATKLWKKELIPLSHFLSPFVPETVLGVIKYSHCSVTEARDKVRRREGQRGHDCGLGE